MYFHNLIIIRLMPMRAVQVMRTATVTTAAVADMLPSKLI